jgi:D-glycero-alpha-D-manno-heptose-7-phosphate kinase
MKQIKEIGLLSEKALVTGKLDDFGALLDDHWVAKQKISSSISTGQVDEWYCAAKKAGALGGKLMGAGGGGFLMVYCQPSTRNAVREALTSCGLPEAKFQFEFEGSRILLNA